MSAELSSLALIPLPPDNPKQHNSGKGQTIDTPSDQSKKRTIQDEEGAKRQKSIEEEELTETKQVCNRSQRPADPRLLRQRERWQLTTLPAQHQSAQVVPDFLLTHANPPRPQPVVELTQIMEQLQQMTNLLKNQQHEQPDVTRSSTPLNNSTKESIQSCMPSNTPKQATVYCDDRVLRVTLVPQDGESLYASIAHHLFGPFRFESELTATAVSLHTSAVRFIQRNKDKFQNDVVELYGKVSPGHGLAPDVAFEHCCLYLMSAGHMGIHLTALAIATLYCRAIAVMDENGQAPIEFSSLYTSSGAPITIIERRNLHNHFDAVDQSEKIDFDAVPKPVTPDQNVDFELLVATWQVRDCSTVEMQNKIDDTLMTYNIDLACIQATFPSKSHLSTAHYTWWCVIDDATNAKGKSRGIGFLLHNDHEGILSDFIFYSEDLASAVLTVNRHKFNIIGCHLPDRTYKQYPRVTAEILNAFKLSQQSPHQLILLGQFNARIGSSEEEQNSVHKNVGPQLLHKEFNESGRLLKKLAVCHNLRIASTYQCENSRTSATYRYPGSNKMLQISHILLQNRDLQTTSNFRWWEPLSNHAIVGCKIVSYFDRVPTTA